MWKFTKYSFGAVLFLIMVGCMIMRPGARMSVADIQAKYPDISYDRALDIKEGRVSIGMTKEMVRDAWGPPDDINRTVSTYGASEQWVYEYNGIYTYDADYVYFEDGKVTTIQS